MGSPLVIFYLFFTLQISLLYKLLRHCDIQVSLRLTILVSWRFNASATHSALKRAIYKPGLCSIYTSRNSKRAVHFFPQRKLYFSFLSPLSNTCVGTCTDSAYREKRDGSHGISTFLSGDATIVRCVYPQQIYGPKSGMYTTLYLLTCYKSSMYCTWGRARANTALCTQREFTRQLRNKAENIILSLFPLPGGFVFLSFVFPLFLYITSTAD